MRATIAIILQHLSLKSTFKPTEIEGQIQLSSQRLIVRSHELPIHKLATLTTIDVVMPEFNFAHVSAKLHEVQHRCDRILPSTHANDNMVVNGKVNIGGLKVSPY
ncbi:hypothetical protein D3C75_665360 [compost metagenome]